MDTHRDEHAFNPEAGRRIKIGTQTWNRFVAKYCIIDGKFTDQLISDSRAYVSNKVWNENTRSMKTAKKPNIPLLVNELRSQRRAWVSDCRKQGIKRYISNISGTDLNSVKSENGRCLNSWTPWKRDDKHNETGSSLCSMAKPPKNACKMWSIPLSGMHSRTIIPCMETYTRNRWMKSAPRRTFASKTMMTKDYGFDVLMERAIE